MADVSQVASPPAHDGGGMTNSQMQANLTGAKEARKRAELDAQLLANRIALLKQEEEKAWKKIEETRKRASEIMDLRKQNEQKFNAKEEFYKAKWESIRNAQAQNAMSRDKAKAMRDETRRGLMEQKHMNAQSTKHQSKQFLLEKKARQEADQEANKQRSAFLKQRKEEAKRRMEEERLAQLEKFREDYEARTAQEDLLRARTDALVAKMEKEEMELIQRLQNTQTVQRNAYEELEAALGQTSQQITSGSRHSQSGPEKPQPAA
mmetsp:Transcript_27925/g.54930  ORF Transcript_27925/g.54930 Transcript_27925/m.54930 type:complete len:264 (+) Transcript_27925:89-880(+)|eukprot:CAMPEP_0172865602 /NCGR_PEP_ID=MMETSP1075-20121228/81499_1 /TAXON_ID=2916 /ORGANISM="Ceratium fusus, Strain PA161109" /LENGTH=263 /DNA_ID=CAMNT_0013714655 /DNA_START=83 /DNA_END=874 /DNA_ORIENTATION=-